MNVFEKALKEKRNIRHRRYGWEYRVVSCGTAGACLQRVTSGTTRRVQFSEARHFELVPKPRKVEASNVFEQALATGRVLLSNATGRGCTVKCYERGTAFLLPTDEGLPPRVSRNPEFYSLAPDNVEVEMFVNLYVRQLTCVHRTLGEADKEASEDRVGEAVRAVLIVPREVAQKCNLTIVTPQEKSE